MIENECSESKDFENETMQIKKTSCNEGSENGWSKNTCSKETNDIEVKDSMETPKAEMKETRTISINIENECSGAIDKTSLDSENDIMVSIKRGSCNERSDNGCSLITSSEETNKIEETDPKKVTSDSKLNDELRQIVTDVRIVPISLPDGRHVINRSISSNLIEKTLIDQDELLEKNSDLSYPTGPEDDKDKLSNLIHMHLEHLLASV